MYFRFPVCVLFAVYTDWTPLPSIGSPATMTNLSEFDPLHQVWMDLTSACSGPRRAAGTSSRTRWSARWSTRPAAWWAKAGTSGSAGRTPRYARLDPGRRACPRRHAVCHAGTVLPPREDPAVYGCGAPRRRAARGGGDGRPVPAGRRRRRSACGRRAVGGRRGRVRSGSTRVERPVPEARPTGMPWVHREMGDDARRQDRHPHRRLQVDQRRGVATGSRTAGPHGRDPCRPRHGGDGRPVARRPGPCRRCVATRIVLASHLPETCQLRRPLAEVPS